MQNANSKTSRVKAALEKMEVGSRAEFPADHLLTARQVASNYGFILGNKYSVAKAEEDGRRIVVVTRTA